MALVRTSPGTSSDSNTFRGYRYDVFLSFRGEETRKTFTDHLYTALNNAGFLTFRDDDELERGGDIKLGLQKAIQQSRTSVVVFSKDYASSSWCLDELVLILERKRTTSDHVVLPVFYDVDPSHVRKQTGSVRKAFTRSQKNQSPEKVEGWRKALAEIADLAGMVLQNQADGYESKFIKNIAKVIRDKLSRTPLSVEPKLIGIQSQAERINLWLQDESSDVGIFVVYGMSGIGKTTIAKQVYNSNFRSFQGSSFIENIKETADQPNGLVQVQMQLLCDILNDREVKIHSVSEGIIKIERAISFRRVLLVLDDVDHMDQLDAILRMKDQFYPGSKILITTRRERLLKADQVTELHIIQTLDYNQSLKLFSWHAFGQDHPIEEYMEHSKQLVQYTGGLPLALKVLGSSLSGQSIGVWESALEKLKVIPDGEIMNKLRISYESLKDDHDRKLFLHIACFLIGRNKSYIVRILDGCDFYTTIGIENLIDRCLVTLDKHGKVKMHDMIRAMGREIVRQESEEPEKRSRLWRHKDSFQVLRKKNGTKKIQGLVLDVRDHPANSPINTNEIVLETNAFARMCNLQLLHLSHVRLDGCYADFPTELRWLCWLEFPLDSIPIDFPLENVIVLEMQYSSLRQVWRGTKFLPSLKILDVSHSHGLSETIDFSLSPNLEELILVDCTSLKNVHESIGNLEQLVYLNMKDCKNLRILPKNRCMLKSLETLILSGCSNLDEFPQFLPSLKILDVSHCHGLSETIDFSLFPNLEELILVDCTSLENVHESIRNLERLVYLNMKDCKNLRKLPKNMCMLKSLETLILSGCSNLDEFPQFLPSLKILDVSHSHGLSETIDFSLFPNLEELILVDCTSLENVHESIGNLERLVYLNMKDCNNLRKLPKNMCMLKSLETLILSGCSNLDESPVEMVKKMESLKVFESYGIPISELWPERSSAILSSFPSFVVELSLKGCSLSDDVLPTDLSNLSHLRRLHLDENPICSLPVFIKGLRRIDELSFKGCDRLESLVGLPEVHHWISIVGCISLKKITFHSPNRQGLSTVGNNWNLIEWEGRYKLEPIDRVDVEMIKLLGLCNLESMPAVRMYNPWTFRDPKEVPVQGLYQGGIFNTFFVGNDVPGRFSYKSTKSSISFIVPLLLASHRIRGLSIFATYAKENSNNYFTLRRIAPIMIKVRNKSKGLKWILAPEFYGIPGDGEDMIWLSHWKMENEAILQCGDEVVVSVITRPRDVFWVKEFGVELVQEHQDKMSTQHNSKSDPDYPFVIGGDLQTWKCRPGIYFLSGYAIKDTDDIDILFMDSDEEDTNKEGQENERDDSIPKTRVASNNYSLRGWKVRLTAVGFFFALALVGWSSISQKKKRHSPTSPPRVCNLT
ncbi:disease resistance protein RUN1-like isoform X1 [Pyrus x bretschneideri]|uniref:disease resistance protein RUN1-like isoform X1 n=1 Tax=Pyrus x bretschneideri TaxID=225117 RepID=UPI00202E8C24|nr:disease resistance protein RUN1-like isoform X1 [Pyrus x bretschneideri]